MLNKGLNHAIKHSKIDLEQNVVDIESYLKYKPDFTETVVRNELKTGIKEMKKLKEYMNRKSDSKFKTLENLRSPPKYQYFLGTHDTIPTEFWLNESVIKVNNVRNTVLTL